MKKFVKLCLHSSYTLQKYFQFDDNFYVLDALYRKFWVISKLKLIFPYRHVKVSYMIVDDMHQNNAPELLRDVFWHQVVPPTLPYTEETAHYRKDEPRGSTEQKDEDIYYSKSQNYSLFKPELRSSKTELANEPSSDYEAVDTNLIGWWKNKIRKSQIRRSLRSLSSLGPHR